MSQIKKGKVSPRKGAKLSLITKQKLSEASSKKIICIETKKVYYSLKNLCDSLGTSYEKWYNYFKKITKNIFGLHYKYLKV